MVSRGRAASEEPIGPQTSGHDDDAPSLIRWLAGLWVSVLVAPLPAIAGPVFSAFLEDPITALKGVFAALGMGFLASGVTLPFIMPSIAIVYVLHRRFGIRSLVIYVLLGQIAATVFMHLMSSSASVTSKLTGGALLGMPNAALFWLVVWWPRIKVGIRDRLFTKGQT